MGGILFAVAFVAMSIAAYPLSRMQFMRETNGRWTVGDRRVAIAFCVFIGPFFFLVFGLMAVIDRLSFALDRVRCWFHDETPAKW